MQAWILAPEQPGQFRWSSYRAFVRGAQERPRWLTCADRLRTRGELTDMPADWRGDAAHLCRLMTDDRRPKDRRLTRSAGAGCRAAATTGRPRRRIFFDDTAGERRERRTGMEARSRALGKTVEG